MDGASSLTASTVGGTARQFELPDDSTVDKVQPLSPGDVVATLKFTEAGRPYIARVQLPKQTSLDGDSRERAIEFLGDLNRLAGLAASTNESESAIDGVIAKRATEYLLRVSVLSANAPKMYPLADRGLLLRWTRGNDSLDIEFDAEGDVVALLKRDGQRTSGYLHNVWRNLTQWLFEAPASA